MKIRAERTGYEGPDSWYAIDDDTYDGAPDSASRHHIGYGATREEAIADLLRLQQEMAEAAEEDYIAAE